MALGRRDLSTLILPVGWDATALQNFDLQNATTYTEIANQVEAGLNALNIELRTHPLWSSLVSYTDQPDVEYRIGSSNGFEEATEYALPNAKRADTTGHMLPLKDFDRRLGWTFRYLEKARTSQLEADIADVIIDARDVYRKQILTRLLKRTDDSGDAYGLGTSGYSPGFATAAASTNVDYTPPKFGGTSFTSDHEHYVGISGGAFTVDVFKDAASELAEHGHVPPYDFLIGTADETAVKALTGFIAVGSQLVVYGNDTALAAPQATGYIGVDGTKYIGTLEDFRVWVVRGIPQYYGVGYKSYGTNSARNVLRIRVPKNADTINFYAMPDPLAGNLNYPLQNLMVRSVFGVGVNDRTGATPRYVNNTTWADGTPT